MVNELVELISEKARTCGAREVFRHKIESSSKWVSTTWHEFENSVSKAAVAFKRLGIKPNDNVAIFSQNREAMFTTDFALFTNRAVPVPLYATSGKEQVKYIVEDAEIDYIFVGDTAQYKIARQVQAATERIRQIIYYQNDVVLDSNDDTSMSFDAVMALADDATDADRAEVETRKQGGSRDDMACLIYTSGTTGEPKGVILTHGNFADQLHEHERRLGNIINREGEVSMNFLPLTHIFERAWSYFCMLYGITVVINTDPREIQITIRDVQPTCMCSVPRFWEKVYTILCDRIEKMAPPKRMLVNAALRTGKKRNLVYRRTGKRVPWLLEKRYQFFEKSIFSRVRSAMGAKNGKLFPTAGAPVSAEIAEFMHCIGVNIVVGYGLTETTATVSCLPEENFVIGSIGTPLSSLSVKIGENDEILVKGPSVMKGYYKKPEANAQAFTADGYFRTGDAGYIDENGNLFITDRIKDLFKTSNGKYIAPQILESRLVAEKLVNQVAIIGEQRKYVTALIVPDYDILREYADKNGIKYTDNASLAANPEIYNLVDTTIKKYQVELAAYEQIKKFTLLPEPFTMESGELTNTLKVKRNVVNKHYAAQIENMYK